MLIEQGKTQQSILMVGLQSQQTLIVGTGSGIFPTAGIDEGTIIECFDVSGLLCISALYSPCLDLTSFSSEERVSTKQCKDTSKCT